MKKKIFYFTGAGDTGKTTKINTVAKWIIDTYKTPNTIGLDSGNLRRDTLGVLIINNLRIGINSSGDNLHEVTKIDTVNKDIDILICCSRTSGKGFQYIKKNYNYNNGWLEMQFRVNNLAPTNITGQTARDNRLIEDLKTWLIGL